MRFILTLVLSTTSSSVFAAFSWQGPFTVKHVETGYINNAAVITVTLNEKIKTGCSQADSKGIMSYWSTDIHPWHTQYQSALLSAQAQGKQVMIYVNGSDCNTHFGAKMHGVKVLNE